MIKERIIYGGIGLVALDQAAKYFEVVYTDALFWLVFAPIAVMVGLTVRHLCPSQ